MLLYLHPSAETKAPALHMAIKSYEPCILGSKQQTYDARIYGMRPACPEPASISHYAPDYPWSPEIAEFPVQ